MRSLPLEVMNLSYEQMEDMDGEELSWFLGYGTEVLSETYQMSQTHLRNCV